MKRLSWKRLCGRKIHWATGKSPAVRKFFQIAKKYKIGGKALDIGCGTGEKTSLIAKKFDTAGIDISRNALRKAKRNYKNILFKESRAEKLNFKDKSFDIVFSNATLQFADLKKSAKEILRVLKPEGIACLFFLVQTVSKGKRNSDISAEIIRAYRKQHFRIIEKKAGWTTDRKPFFHRHKILTLILRKV